MYTHTRTHGAHAGPLRRRDDGGTSYIIYVDIILTTCVEYYTECVMSLIDPVTTGSQELEVELVPKSSLHNVFFPKRIWKKKTKKTCTVKKKDAVNHRFPHATDYMCVYMCARAGSRCLYTEYRHSSKPASAKKKKKK
jgi:hypothetical protein